jgi:hypothetical protein
MKRRLFKDFLSDIEFEYWDVLYYTEVRLFSRGRMIKRDYDLKSNQNSFFF